MIKRLQSSRFFNVIKTTFTISVLCVFLFYGFQFGPLYKDLLKDIEVVWLLTVIGILMLQNVLAAWFTSTLVSEMSASLDFISVLRIHVARLPARYLPGGIWHVASKLYDFHSQGVKTSKLTGLAFYETSIPIMITLLIGGGVVFFSDLDLSWIWMRISLFAALVAMILIIVCGALGRIKKFETLLVSRVIFYKACIVSALYWALAGLGFSFYLGSLLGEVALKNFTDVWGVYIFSWGIGNLAIFAPQGLGVLEWMVDSMLPMLDGVGAMMVVAAGYRIMIFISDVLCFLIFTIGRLSKVRFSIKD
ncbi:MAG: hypothetical protein R3E74_12865 [Pseudomonadales bacterium]